MMRYVVDYALAARAFTGKEPPGELRSVACEQARGPTKAPVTNDDARPSWKAGHAALKSQPACPLLDEPRTSVAWLKTSKKFDMVFPVKWSAAE